MPQIKENDLRQTNDGTQIEYEILSLNLRIMIILMEGSCACLNL
jgi:hypothetical protein